MTSTGVWQADIANANVHTINRKVCVNANANVDGYANANGKQTMLMLMLMASRQC